MRRFVALPARAAVAQRSAAGDMPNQARISSRPPKLSGLSSIDNQANRYCERERKEALASAQSPKASCSRTPSSGMPRRLDSAL